MEKVLKQLSVRQKGIIDAEQIKGFETARQKDELQALLLRGVEEGLIKREIITAQRIGFYKLATIKKTTGTGSVFKSAVVTGSGRAGNKVRISSRVIELKAKKTVKGKGRKAH